MHGTAPQMVSGVPQPANPAARVELQRAREALHISREIGSPNAEAPGLENRQRIRGG